MRTIVGAFHQWALSLRSRPVLRGHARCGRRRAGLVSFLQRARSLNGLALRSAGSPHEAVAQAEMYLSSAC